MRQLGKRVLGRVARVTADFLRSIDEPLPVADPPPPPTPPPPDRVADAIEARSQLGEDFFGGWAPEDKALFERYRSAAASQNGFVTDFLGIRTALHMVPWLANHDGALIDRLPIPDDAVRAEAIEYFALLDAFARHPGPSFTMMEVGASYAPWTCAGGVLARRAGIGDVSLTAVEGSSFMCGLIHQHLADNRVVAVEGACTINVVHAAVARASGTLFFPKLTSAGDNGSQASAAKSESDYRGLKVDHEEVPAKRLAELMPAGRIVDFLHLDIQGHEFEVLSDALPELGERVRRLFIGTHSRLLEGQLLQLMHGAGWELVRERPTRFAFLPAVQQITGWTTRDGGQYWRNPMLN